MRLITQGMNTRWRCASHWTRKPTVLSLMILPLFSFGCWGAPQNDKAESLDWESLDQEVQKTPLQAEPSVVRMGKVAADQSRTTRFKVVNLGDKDVQLDRVESTCSCLRVLGIPLTIGAQSSRELTITYDPREEPEFRGGLSIGLIGRDQAGVEQFHSRVELSVVDQQGSERKEP